MSTIQVNMHEAKSRLSQLAEKAWSGDTIIIAKSGKPYLELIPHKASSKPRKPGHYKGKIKISKDFDQTSLDIIEEIHRDPFDRMLVAQAQSEGLELLTVDGMISKYGVRVIDASK